MALIQWKLQTLHSALKIISFFFTFESAIAKWSNASEKVVGKQIRDLLKYGCQHLKKLSMDSGGEWGQRIK